MCTVREEGLENTHMDQGEENGESVNGQPVLF